MLPFLVHNIFTIYINGVLNCKFSKGLISDVNTHMPFQTLAVLCRDLEQLLSEQHGRSTAEARHGHGMVRVNQRRPHCVNQMGKT